MKEIKNISGFKVSLKNNFENLVNIKPNSKAKAQIHQ